jgi:nucleotide-binding universal stress UspA family protein
MQQSIICGVDGSQASRSAANVAAALADTLGHELALVNVARCVATFPDHDAGLREYQRRRAIQRGEQLLETVARGLPGDAPERFVASGTPARTLKAWSRLDGVALVVVGSRGYGARGATLFRGVSGRLASAAGCPMVIVPETDAAGRFLARRPEGQAIVCALDGSRDAASVLDVAAGLADRMQLDVRPIWAGSQAAKALRRGAQDDDVLLIVVGSRGPGWLRSTWRALAAAGPLPVVVVPPAVRPTVREWTPLAAAPGCITHRTSARRGRAVQDPS